MNIIYNLVREKQVNLMEKKYKHLSTRSNISTNTLYVHNLFKNVGNLRKKTSKFLPGNASREEIFLFELMLMFYSNMSCGIELVLIN